MASYKNHCSFSFIKVELLNDIRLKESKNLKPIQGCLGKIMILSDLPTDQEFISFLKEAMDLNEKGVKVFKKKSNKAKVIETPDYFTEILAANLKVNYLRASP
tara:strand:+ start:181 stop:489 length:309 start_codon:yes stop_codon:yes gene_type:complete